MAEAVIQREKEHILALLSDMGYFERWHDYLTTLVGAQGCCAPEVGPASGLLGTLRQTQEVIGRVAISGCLEVLPPQVGGDDHLSAMAIHKREKRPLAALDFADCIVFGDLPALVGVATNMRDGMMAVIARIFVDAHNLCGAGRHKIVPFERFIALTQLANDTNRGGCVTEKLIWSKERANLVFAQASFWHVPTFRIFTGRVGRKVGPFSFRALRRFGIELYATPSLALTDSDGPLQPWATRLL